MCATRTPLLFVPLLVTLAATFAQAQATEPTKVFAILNGGDIAPASVLTGAFGLAELTIDSAKGEVAVSLDAFNLPTRVSGAHVHVGSPGVVGPVLLDLRPNQRMAGDVEISGTLNSGNLTTAPDLGIRDLGDALQAIIGLATYIDIHTEGHGDGEIRGLLVISLSDCTATASACTATAVQARRALGQTTTRR